LSRGRTGLLAALLIAVPLNRAIGLEPPRTGLSGGLQTPVPLLDDDANTFLFPQLAAHLDPAVYAFAGTGNSTVSASGARIRAAGQTIQYQNRLMPASTASRLVTYFSSPFYQISWAAGAGAFRVGTAFTWSTSSRRETRRGIQESISGRNEIFDSQFEGVDTREATVGIGWSGFVTVDVVLEAGWETLRFDVTRVQRTLDLSTTLTDRTTTRITAETPIGLGGGIRLSVPVGAATDLRLFAHARDTTHDFRFEYLDELVRNAVPVRDSTRVADWDDQHGSEVSGGLRLETTPAGSNTVWSVHAYGERIRSAWRYIPRTDGGRRYARRDDRYQLGCSLVTPGPVGLEFLGGLSIEYLRARERQEDVPLDLTQRIDSRSVATEDTNGVMAWGARRSFPRIDLSGTLRTSFLPLNPIASLDIRVPF